MPCRRLPPEGEFQGLTTRLRVSGVDIIDDPRHRHSVTGSDAPDCYTWVWTGPADNPQTGTPYSDVGLGSICYCVDYGLGSVYSSYITHRIYYTRAEIDKSRGSQGAIAGGFIQTRTRHATRFFRDPHIFYFTGPGHHVHLDYVGVSLL